MLGIRVCVIYIDIWVFFLLDFFLMMYGMLFRKEFVGSVV